MEREDRVSRKMQSSSKRRKKPKRSRSKNFCTFHASVKGRRSEKETKKTAAVKIRKQKEQAITAGYTHPKEEIERYLFPLA
jgi:hypothetical protein